MPNIVDVGSDRRFFAGAWEITLREFAGEQFIKDDPKRVNVRPVVDVRRVLPLFRCHVGRGAENLTRLG